MLQAHIYKVSAHITGVCQYKLLDKSFAVAVAAEVAVAER